MEAKKLYFMDCHLAGKMYHEADEVWENLKVGTRLYLERDLENRYDPNAVAVVYYKLDTDEEELPRYVVGYIPRDENSELAAFLEMGWGEIFECRINRIIPDAHPEQQVHLTIKIRRNEKVA
jgi:hypothetical protein